ncbi:MAG: zf-HC2 domain-containing protein [Clostridia bacterium]|nr:zf-HC2 domain-containing protein [Clostridia bacterium]
MKNECSIVRDLLPLYVENMVSEETANFVKAHLEECKNCREDYETMKSTDGFAEKKRDHSEDIKMANSLKNFKNKINKKIRNTVLCVVAAALVVIVGFNLLFHAAIKNVSPEDISVTADVYAFAELTENPIDNTDFIEVKIPEFGTMMMTEDVIENSEYVTVISVGSEYFIRAIKSEVKNNILYIRSFNTTLLNNKAQSYQKQFSYVELQEISQIVFVNSDGSETVLWSK